MCSGNKCRCAKKALECVDMGAEEVQEMIEESERDKFELAMLDDDADVYDELLEMEMDEKFGEKVCAECDSRVRYYNSVVTEEYGVLCMECWYSKIE